MTPCGSRSASSWAGYQFSIQKSLRWATFVSELDDDAADVGVPLVDALVAEVAVHLGDQGVAHLRRRSPASTGTDFRTWVTVLFRATRFVFFAGLELRQGLDDPVHALLQVLHGRGVGEADVIVGAERVARDDGHPGLLQEVIGHAVGVADGHAVELLSVSRTLTLGKR